MASLTFRLTLPQSAPPGFARRAQATQRLLRGRIFQPSVLVKRRARHESGFARHENACSAGFTKEGKVDSW